MIQRLNYSFDGYTFEQYAVVVIHQRAHCANISGEYSQIRTPFPP